MPIALDHVSFSYAPNQPVLEDISLQVEDGAFVGIMGRTGSGKTTLIQLIAGLLEPTGGHVLLDGRDIGKKGYDRTRLRREIGFVFQYPEYQLFETTVEKDVAFGLKYSGLDRSERAERVRWALETMGFSDPDILEQSPLTLSGGEKRRVAIAGILAVRPKILIFDEPVAGLDPMARASFLSLVADLNRGGTTVLMVSHNADALAECARRILVLDQGHIVLDGTPFAVFSRLSGSRKGGVSTPFEIASRLAAKGIPLGGEIASYADLLTALRQRFPGGAST